MNDRAGFLASLDVLAGRVAAIAPSAKVAFIARAPVGDWGVYFNGQPLIMGHDAADLCAADALFDDAAHEGILPFLQRGPYLFAAGARLRPMARAGGPVADA